MKINMKKRHVHTALHCQPRCKIMEVFGCQFSPCSPCWQKRQSCWQPCWLPMRGHKYWEGAQAGGLRLEYANVTFTLVKTTFLNKALILELNVSATYHQMLSDQAVHKAGAARFRSFHWCWFHQLQRIYCFPLKQSSELSACWQKIEVFCIHEDLWLFFSHWKVQILKTQGLRW